jgi:hypothetical protein
VWQPFGLLKAVNAKRKNVVKEKAEARIKEIEKQIKQYLKEIDKNDKNEQNEK